MSLGLLALFVLSTLGLLVLADFVIRAVAAAATVAAVLLLLLLMFTSFPLVLAGCMPAAPDVVRVAAVLLLLLLLLRGASEHARVCEGANEHAGVQRC